MPSIAPATILFVTSELFPLIKTGGLADISGALPIALRRLGLDVRCLLPAYPAVLARFPRAKTVADLSALAGEMGAARLLETTLQDGDLPLFLLDCPALYGRTGGPYMSPDGQDWLDNVLRFGFLCQVGALISTADSPLAWKPGVVHCNDWQSGLIPALLHFSKSPHARSVMSIHNLMFQGSFGEEWVTRLGLPAASYTMEGVEFYGKFSFLKAGIFYADQISTVSHTYAQEIQTPEFGYGMDGLLRSRRADLHGIMNGIADDWNPATDKCLWQNYDVTTLEKKAVNKLKLQAELDLKVGADIPLFCVVSRLTHQKGIDMILDCAYDLLRGGAQLAVLGSGEAVLEQRLRELVRSQPGRASVTFGYDEELAHRLVAGGDIFLMPSRFEPCGLSQMYAMSYGTPPVVRRTGGLSDTVIGSDPESLHIGDATGFIFAGQSSASLMRALRHALKLYREKDIWRAIQKNGMERDFGWDKAAAAYAEIYRKAMQAPQRKPERLASVQPAQKTKRPALAKG